jgi:hypothetical protein
MREKLRPDPVLLGAGLLIALVGVAILLDSSGVLTLSLGWVACGLTALLGALLLLGGLSPNRSGRHD